MPETIPTSTSSPSLPSTAGAGAYQPAGYCPRCGYRTDPGVCPECGFEIAPEKLAKISPLVYRFRRRVALVVALLCLGWIGWFGRAGFVAAFRWACPTSIVLNLWESDGAHKNWAEAVLNERLARGRLGRAATFRYVRNMLPFESPRSFAPMLLGDRLVVTYDGPRSPVVNPIMSPLGSPLVVDFRLVSLRFDGRPVPAELNELGAWSLEIGPLPSSLGEYELEYEVSAAAIDRARHLIRAGPPVRLRVRAVIVLEQLPSAETKKVRVTLKESEQVSR